MRHVSNAGQFLSLAPSAPGMFAYVSDHRLLRKMALEFEYGVLADDGGARAVAKFTSRGSSFCRSAVVWVSAIGNSDGGWRIRHSIGSLG